MGYIVCAVVVEENKVLVIQEAKLTCSGMWYLPAGRMERNETIVVREVEGEKKEYPVGLLQKMWLGGRLALILPA